MERKAYKLFIEKNNGKTQIVISEYPSGDIDYYLFIKQNKEKGRIQLIVNSNIMIFLLNYYFYERGGDVYDLKLVEEDEEFSSKIERFLDLIRKEKDAFELFIEHLQFLKSDNSIDIQEFSVRVPKDDGVTFIIIQSNGVIHIEGCSYMEEVENLQKVMGGLYG